MFGGDIVDPTKLLRRRSSLVVQDLPLPGDMRTGRGAGHGTGHGGVAAKTMSMTMNKTPVTAFQEPDANSLLDSFGF